jgi:hypothetical protein
MIFGHRSACGFCVTGQQGAHAAVNQRANGIHGFVNDWVHCSTRSNAGDHVGRWSVDARVPDDQAQPLLKPQAFKPMKIP